MVGVGGGRVFFLHFETQQGQSKDGWTYKGSRAYSVIPRVCRTKYPRGDS